MKTELNDVDRNVCGPIFDGDQARSAGRRNAAWVSTWCFARHARFRRLGKPRSPSVHTDGKYRDAAFWLKKRQFLCCLSLLVVVFTSPAFGQLLEDSPSKIDPWQESALELLSDGSGSDVLELSEQFSDEDTFRFEAGVLDRNLIEINRDSRSPKTRERSSLLDRVVSDHRHFYDLQSFRLLASGFLIGGAIANTQLDQQLHDHFQVSVAGATSDDWSEFLHADKELGNGRYTLPLFATAWALGASFEDSPLLVTSGRWGERSLRSFLIGAPPLMLAQRLTGGSRPSEKDRDSRWLPFQDNNGVSGHAFMASLPFINAAKMTHNRWLKASLYAGSLVGPLSRVNDDAHYPSQVALGWWMAFVAASAVDRTERSEGRMRFLPYVADGGYGGMLELEF